MNMIISSSSFLTPSVLYQTDRLRQELDILVKEQISGKTSDVSAHLKGDFTALSAMDNEISRLRGFSIMTVEASIWAEMMGSALGVINGEAESLLSRLTVSSSIDNQQQLKAITADAASMFDNIIATLNSRSSDRALFSGDGGDTSPLPAAATLLDELALALGGTATADEMQSRIETWFFDPAGFEALYMGGAPRAAYAIGRGESISLGITAMDPALRGTLAAIASLALLDRGMLASAPEEQFKTLTLVTQQLSVSGEARSHITSRLGIAQERIEKAQVRNAAGLAALQIARSELLEIDPYETAVKLKDLEAKLESFYTILSRLSNLSLINFLR